MNAQIPAEIKELLPLIRHGHLFEVEQWLKDEKPSRAPLEAPAKASPLLVAIETGFHSMVEVLLSHFGKEEDLGYALSLAIRKRRLDLVELLHRFGADPKVISYEYISRCGSSEIIRWFEEKGVDLVTRWPVAKILAEGNRIALGTLMRCKDRIPELQVQLDSALRVQAEKGSLRWVSLLMWAGGNPRAVVPDITDAQPEEWMGTALEDGARSGNVAVLKKLGVRSEDDVTALLYLASANVELVAYLLELGADPNAAKEGDTTMQRFMHHWEWNLDSRWGFGCKPFREPLKALEFLGTKGGRWVPTESYHLRSLRAALAKARPYDAISDLQALMNAGVFSKEVFCNLMATPKMQALLAEPYLGIQKLRDYADRKNSVYDVKSITTETRRWGAKRRMGRK